MFCDGMLFLLLVLGVLVSVAFLTLMERKILGYVQIRKGPNKVGFLGIFQPFSDALKLFFKGQLKMEMSNYFLYLIAPLGSLMLSLFIWCVFFLKENFLDFCFGVLFFFACSSMGVYFILVGGWSSNSKYGLLGAYRAVAQTISYEVSMAFILLVIVLMGGGFDFEMYVFWMWMCVISLMVFFMWLISVLAELNRTPFDFAEGESELVSGFNVEYSGGVFAMIFIAEYAMILLMSMITVLLFLSGKFLVFKILMLSFYIILMRGTVVRFRYDKLMMLVWKNMLPNILNVLIFFGGLIYFFWGII